MAVVKRPLANYSGALKELQADDVVDVFAYGSDVAAASTVTLGIGTHFNITGSVNISDIDFTLTYPGRVVWLRFAAALTLTHSSTLILPNAVDLDVEAGDILGFVAQKTADVVECFTVHRANNNLGIQPSNAVVITGGTMSNVLCTSGGGFSYGALQLWDGSLFANLTIRPGSSMSANRTLTLDVGNANRTVTLGGNVTLDQSVDTAATPTFAAVNVGNADTTLARTAPGELAVEGNRIFRVGGAPVPIAEGGHAGATTSAARTNLGVPRTLFVFTTDAPTTVTTDQVLYTGSVAANTLATNGDRLYFEYSGYTGGTTNAKRPAVWFGGTIVFAITGSNMLSNGLYWIIRGCITRVDDATLRCITTLQVEDYNPFVQYADLVSYALSSTAYDIEFKARTPTVSGDLTATGAWVELKPHTA